MGRQDGFYWVLITDGWNVEKWHVAEWDGSEWWLPGVEVAFTASNFQQIDERRLVRPDEVK